MVTGGSAKYSREELMEGSRIDKVLWDKIDPDLWLEPVTPTSTAIHLNTMIARTIRNYTSEQLFDGDLFYAFREEFEDWTQQMFEAVELPFRREMKRFLRTRGVYTGSNKGKMGRQLHALTETEDNPKWDPTELDETVFEPGSRRKTTTKQNLPQRALSLSGTTPDSVKVTPSVEVAEDGDQPTPPTLPFRPVQQMTNPYSWVPPKPSTYPVTAPFPPPVIPPTYDAYKSLPPRPVPNERLDPTKATQFIKTFDREKRYTGEPYDLLDDKMRILFNICFHAEITPGKFHVIFPRILTGRAEEYYLHYVERSDDFATACAKIKNHLDINVNHNQYYTDWTSTNLKVRQQNPDKNLHDVLRMLLDKTKCKRVTRSVLAFQSYGIIG